MHALAQQMQSETDKFKVKFVIQSWTKYVETDCEFIQKSAKVHFTKIVTKPHIYVKGTKNITFAPLNDM